MSQNCKICKILPNLKFQIFQLDNLVDFEKCCKTRIFLQKSLPIQPKTSNILPKICQTLASTLRFAGPPRRCGSAFWDTGFEASSITDDGREVSLEQPNSEALLKLLDDSDAPEADVALLVERFDVEPLSDFSAK